MHKPIVRLLKPLKDKSFFLFGPRGVGKSTWVSQVVKADLKLNLLEHRLYLELLRDPSLLESKVAHLKEGSWIYIDEIQKIPALLSEVHRLIEERKFLFALTGSSARKIKQGGADLLGGRAVRRFMEPFSFAELGDLFDLDRALLWGTLPLVYLDPENSRDTLEAYVHTYLKEEIREEGLIRKLDPFLRFLEVTSILHSQQINSDAIARDARVPRSSVDGYFSILEDTLVGFRLPSYQPKAKVREATHPKFFWFDSGVARTCAQLLPIEPDTTWLGGSLETLIYRELRTYNHTFQKMRPFFYYRTASGLEIDFVIELQPGSRVQKPEVILIEVKFSQKWDRSWNRSMIALQESNGVKVKKMFGIYRGSEILTFQDIQILPVETFLTQLYRGEIF